MSVPLKYHHAISQQGGFFRNLRSYGVHVDQSIHPQRSAVPACPPQDATSTARIDDTEEDIPESNWQVVLNYQDAEEGDSEWTLRSKDAPSLERAEGDIKAAIEQAEAMTHVGFLTLVDRSSFPRIVGTKGSNVARLRAETGADITVSRDSNIIVVIGAFPQCISRRWSSSYRWQVLNLLWRPRGRRFSSKPRLLHDLVVVQTRVGDRRSLKYA